MNIASEHRVGMIVLRIECERSAPDRLLIRVKTVAEGVPGASFDERSFATIDGAHTYLREWLDVWPHGGDPAVTPS